jgi:hypothetical protein
MPVLDANGRSRLQIARFSAKTECHTRHNLLSLRKFWYMPCHIQTMWVRICRRRCITSAPAPLSAPDRREERDGMVLGFSESLECGVKRGKRTISMSEYTECNVLASKMFNLIARAIEGGMFRIFILPMCSPPFRERYSFCPTDRNDQGTMTAGLLPFNRINALVRMSSRTSRFQPSLSLLLSM